MSGCFRWATFLSKRSLGPIEFHEPQPPSPQASTVRIKCFAGQATMNPVAHCGGTLSPLLRKAAVSGLPPVSYSATIFHYLLLFPFRDAYYPVDNPPPFPLCSLESCDYKLFPYNLLTPSGLQVTALFAVTYME